MRIGIMGLSSFGGSARIASQLAKKLARRGHRIHLFTRTPSPFQARGRAKGVIFHTALPDLEAEIHPAKLDVDWSAKDYQTFLSRIFDVIATEGLDVLHFHYAVPFAFLAEKVRQTLGKAAPLLVGTLHGTDVSIYGRDRAYRLRLKQALARMDALTTVSTSHARLAANLFKLSVHPQVIPNFIDLSNFRPQGPFSWPQPYPMPANGKIIEHDPIPDSTGKREAYNQARPRIVHISNFRPVKDAKSMARIFVGIRQHMAAELWLIGEGPDMPGVVSILQQGQVEDDVRYCGLQSHVAPLLAQTDLLLMTSLSESFCLTALEAMACNVPVLATQVGGLPEVVVHGKTGFLYPAGDHDTAVRTAVNLLSSPAQHHLMRVTAGQHATKFSHTNIVPAYENLYQRLLSQKSKKVYTVSAAPRSLQL